MAASRGTRSGRSSGSTAPSGAGGKASGSDATPKRRGPATKSAARAKPGSTNGSTAKRPRAAARTAPAPKRRTAAAKSAAATKRGTASAKPAGASKRRTASNGVGPAATGGASTRRRSSREAQAAAHAKRSKAKVDSRREQATGAAGWVADRAGDWSLEGVDAAFMERQKYLWNPLMDYWFRMEMGGWDLLPEAPALLIGIHSGAPFVWDAWTVGVQWYRRFGTERVLHGTAHDALMAAPVIGGYFRRMGVLPAAPDSIAAALAAGHDVALWPGGEIDSLRTWAQRDEAILAGRMGFVRMAINAGVPIVPIATVGGPDSMPVLFKGRRLARLLQLDKVARLKMFPIALSAPWGIAPAMLPEIPLPTKIRTAFQEPIEVLNDPDKAADEDYVRAKYEETQASIQRGMDALARRRRFPVFG